MRQLFFWVVIGLFTVLVSVPQEVNCQRMTNAKKRPLIDDTKCPRVKPMRHFNLNKIRGSWLVQQYYSSSEEALLYSCMRAALHVESPGGGHVHVLMNFTYSYVDDPRHEMLLGNITWVLPDVSQPAHWLHAEDTYAGVYNTYVLDTDYSSWLLLLHCAEQDKTPRYLSSLLMTRQEQPLNVNVVSYLRDKLGRYGVNLDYMFPMQQDEKCNDLIGSAAQINVAHPAFQQPRTKT